MKIGYLDCFAGMSSSRFIGALADAGVPEQVLHDAVDALDVGAKLELTYIKRNNIQTIRAHVTLSGNMAYQTPYYELPTFVQDNHSLKDNAYLLGTIIELISNAQLPQKAQNIVISTFRNLAIAEAKVRGVSVEEIYFHSVKSLNTVVGVTLCAVGCVWLGVERWYASPLNVGSGILRHPQGAIPIPTPTTLELLGKNAALFAQGPQRELFTATCAALMKALEVDFSPCPPIYLSAVGYGGGRVEYDSLPNFLRLSVGEEKQDAKYSPSSKVIIMETECAFVIPEIIQEQLYDCGAQLVYTIAIKSIINGIKEKLVILSNPETANAIRCCLLEQLKVKYVHWRLEDYDHLIHYKEPVITPWGKVNVTVGQLLDNQIVTIVPEEVSCREISSTHNLPYDQVIELIKRLFISRKKIISLQN